MAGQEGGEGMTQAVNIDGLTLGVAFGDIGRSEVQVECSQEVATKGKQWRLRGDLTAIGSGH